MSKAVWCDVCKKLDYGDSRCSVKFWGKCEPTKDLCDECARELRKWVEQRSKSK